MPVKTQQTVESFSIQLESFQDVLVADELVQAIEELLLARLETPERLLRWAIVHVEKDSPKQPFRCEGAYLKKG